MAFADNILRETQKKLPDRIPSSGNKKEFSEFLEQLSKMGSNRIEQHYTVQQLKTLAKEAFKREENIMREVVEFLRSLFRFVEKWRGSPEVDWSERAQFCQICNEVELLLREKRRAAYLRTQYQFSEDEFNADWTKRPFKTYSRVLKHLDRVYMRYYDIVKQGRDVYRRAHPNAFPFKGKEEEEDHYRYILGPIIHHSREREYNQLDESNRTTSGFDFESLYLEP